MPPVSTKPGPWGKVQLVLGIMTVAGRARKTMALDATSPRPACQRHDNPMITKDVQDHDARRRVDAQATRRSTTVRDAVPLPAGRDCVRVGVDGADVAGKTVFADQLAELLLASGREVVRISADGFHILGRSVTSAEEVPPRAFGETRTTTTSSGPTCWCPSGLVIQGVTGPPSTTSARTSSSSCHGEKRLRALS
jgi:hypothetical protein